MQPTFEVLPPGGQRPPQPKPQGSFRTALVALGVLLLKFKTVASMALSIWLYSYAWGWPFAVGFVLLIFVHEMGHVVAAKWLGLPVSAPLFIPFVGAAIVMKQNPRDAWTEALMAYGGPLAGGAGAGVCWWIAVHGHAPFMMALASAGFLLNLFNLIPLPPLDGGRICAAVSPWFWILGFLMLGAAVLFFRSQASFILILIILVISISRLKQTFLTRNTPEMQRYYGLPFSDRVVMALMYLGLIAALLLGYWDAHDYLRNF